MALFLFLTWPIWVPLLLIFGVWATRSDRLPGEGREDPPLWRAVLGLILRRLRRCVS